MRDSIGTRSHTCVYACPYISACTRVHPRAATRACGTCTCFFLFLFARDRASERASERANALARAFLLIGKYRNARNIEHLDGTASMLLPHRGASTGAGGQGEIGGVGHVGGCGCGCGDDFFDDRPLPSDRPR